MGDIGRRQTRFEVLPVVAGVEPPGDDAVVERTTEHLDRREHVGARTEPARS